MTEAPLYRLDALGSAEDCLRRAPVVFNRPSFSRHLDPAGPSLFFATSAAAAAENPDPTSRPAYLRIVTVGPSFVLPFCFDASNHPDLVGRHSFFSAQLERCPGRGKTGTISRRQERADGRRRRTRTSGKRAAVEKKEKRSDRWVSDRGRKRLDLSGRPKRQVTSPHTGELL